MTCTVITLGGYAFHDAVKVERALEEIHFECAIELIVNCGGRGSDVLAAAWARENGIKVREYQATFRAGDGTADRAKRAVTDHPGATVLVFPMASRDSRCGASRGAVELARSLGMQIVEVTA